MLSILSRKKSLLL